jgi:hypothetical protein
MPCPSAPAVLMPCLAPPCPDTPHPEMPSHGPLPAAPIPAIPNRAQPDRATPAGPRLAVTHHAWPRQDWLDLAVQAAPAGLPGLAVTDPTSPRHAYPCLPRLPSRAKPHAALSRDDLQSLGLPRLTQPAEPRRAAPRLVMPGHAVPRLTPPCNASLSVAMPRADSPHHACRVSPCLALRTLGPPCLAMPRLPAAPSSAPQRHA